jgi:hypothetical protein
MTAVISVAASVIGLVLPFRRIFVGLSGSVERVPFRLPLEIISAFGGEYIDDFYSELRLFLRPLGWKATGLAVYGVQTRLAAWSGEKGGLASSDPICGREPV